ncbi:MAG: transporter [Bacteroidota bacterium]
MTDLEFDILDELYFVISYSDLQNASEVEDADLIQVLYEMILKGWVRCFENASDEIEIEEDTFRAHYRDYYYLASKKGLMIHNRG